MYTPSRIATRGLSLSVTLALLSLGLNQSANAATNTLDELKQEIQSLRTEYEKRLQTLESQLKAAESAKASPAPTPATPAPSATVATENSRPQSNSFNPAIGLVLSGTYARLSQKPEDWRISGFTPAAEIGPGPRGFSLGESELSFSANVDQLFYGRANIALSSENEVGVEEAFLQTIALPKGLGVKAGRFFSGIGYQNSQHAHTWDFVDAPLAYQAFFGRQYAQDGVQLKWLAPTATFFELGAELGRGHNFPGQEVRSQNRPGATSVFAHIGDDIGSSQSWQAGLSWLTTRAQDRAQSDADLFGNRTDNQFTGTSRLLIADLVWKWTPSLNQKVKLQAEWLRRNESGDFTWDTANTAQTDRYKSRQSGWYLQSTWQFARTWQTALRYERLQSGTVDYASNSANLENSTWQARKLAWQLSWQPSEFSRIRLQLARDKAREGLIDNQIFLQYQINLGAHGAHAY